jgi:hypothetical protein
MPQEKKRRTYIKNSEITLYLIMYLYYIRTDPPFNPPSPSACSPRRLDHIENVGLCVMLNQHSLEKEGKNRKGAGSGLTIPSHSSIFSSFSQVSSNQGIL